MSDARRHSVSLGRAGGAGMSEFRKVKDWNSCGGSAELDQSVSCSSVKAYSQPIKQKQFVQTLWKCLMVEVS